MTSYRQITHDRISQSSNLIPVLHLGNQALTGVFPTDATTAITQGPLELVWCEDSGLLQLNHSYDPAEMYGDNYGYRSGLNQTMIDHLTNKVNYLERMVTLQDNDVVVDIGSNDATTLKAYSHQKIRRIGIDPTGKKFKHHYTDDITLVADFFSEEAYHSVEINPARIVTSIAMFYDLESPISFAKQVESILADDGVWHLEQSYMPYMLRLNSYDTICHEHLEYYSLSTVKKILETANFRLIDVVTNDINGGSFAVTAAKSTNKTIKSNQLIIDWMLEQEDRLGLNTIHPYAAFKERVHKHRAELTSLIGALNAAGKKVLGYGASTKGNVVLQFCGFTEKDIPAIAEVNPDKFNCVTPGTHIPIISELEARAMNPDYFLLLPWHFKEGVLRREKHYMAQGGKFILPFPEVRII
ncbi:class I SAM-dependent methyltransferase [Coxiella burnetii]|uniref:class I SAM-dependent methyltransferase n=1 Tax=Coxiella burnetii TaxID=777 RepID=UPI0000ED014F|nr:class I SAM-dependent methyltransferase [Coxiella burnetii]ACJ20722.1 methyltransferase [Coxiella burnetii CbuK_Q154]AIT63797.1 NDP-hexose 3-C-methyltransferase TylCIII [Coxiella burnetii str. Namibia]ATN86312.1 methyltransferase [Coxiella burnetii str. Schperling]EAX33292.1 methyltransferase [Coxiella burnetii 'MSU Goat Q177']EDR36454.1 NDP-hexose 3-C-methyltransferase TylCIII [Coxiella burnetii Q321]